MVENSKLFPVVLNQFAKIGYSVIAHAIAHASSEHFHILSRRQRYWKPKVGRFQLSKNLTHDKQPNWCIAEIACEIMYAHCTQHASGNDVGKQRRGMRLG